MQLPLAGFQGPVFLGIFDYFGPIGNGASAAHYMRADNGQEYIVKGTAFTPQWPFLAVNEYIATRLADMLGLPVLDYRLVNWGGHVCFASAWMEKDTYYPDVTLERFMACENLNIVYGVITFDAWVCNVDRHNQNLLVRRTRPGHVSSGERLSLLLNDHGHCLMPPPETPANLSGRLVSPIAQYSSLPFLRESITDPLLLGDAITRIERLGDGLIEAVVRSVPEFMLQSSEQEELIRFLGERRQNLRDLFEVDHSIFPNLGKEVP